MDKKSIIAVVLVSVIVFGWMLWQQSNYEPPEVQTADSVKTETSEQRTRIPDKEDIPEVEETVTDADIDAADTAGTEQQDMELARKFGPSFAPFATGDMKIITIENEFVKAKISSKGLTIFKWQLKKYDKWDGVPTQLIWNNKGELFMSFVSMEGASIDTRDLYFDFEDDYKEHYRLSGKQTLTLAARLKLDDNKYIRKTITFTGNSYVTDHNLELNNLESIIPSRGYNYVWSDGLRYQEKNSVEETQSAMGMISQNEDIAEVTTTESEVEEAFTGQIDYVAVKTKYFGAAAIPEPGEKYDGTVDIFGDHDFAKNDGQVTKYGFSYRIPYDGGKKVNTFKVFIGPLEYGLVDSLGLKEMVSLGWRYGIRQIAEYVMLPLLTFIHKFIPNYGVTIIIFSILIKFLLYPLSIQQMRSASKMKLLQPEMEKLREKYKDDNTKQSQETMKLYGQYGVNPMGGCFPMLLQMPILFALWSLLRNAIDLRQSEFIWWITDLSVPDKIVDFGFSFLGLSHLSGLAILMGAAMFFQQKMTITDPRQKSMIYMMPVMFVFMFSNFPAGLNLYYFMFNLLGIGQQVYINKFSKNKVTLEDLKKSPKKEGWLQKKMREAQDMAEKQGRSVPGQAGKSYDNANKGNQRKKKKKK